MACLPCMFSILRWAIVSVSCVMNEDVGFMGLAIAPLSMPFERVSSAIFNEGGFLISLVELQEEKVKRLKEKRRKGE